MQRLMNESILNYHKDRSHFGLNNQTRAGSVAKERSNANGKVVSMLRLSGINHGYDVAA